MFHQCILVPPCKILIYGTLCQKLMSLFLVLTLFIVGCGGTAPNPVDRYQPGDEKKSCNALYSEMNHLDEEIVLKKNKKTGRDVWNVIFFITGFLVIVPWFFIDAKGSHEVEIEALKARKNALTVIFSDKDCSPPSVTAEKDTQGN